MATGWEGTWWGVPASGGDEYVQAAEKPTRTCRRPRRHPGTAPTPTSTPQPRSEPRITRRQPRRTATTRRVEATQPHPKNGAKPPPPACNGAKISAGPYGTHHTGEPSRATPPDNLVGNGNPNNTRTRNRQTP
ncbi:hypothetical protein GCM10027091_76180 [Streptomyces daliensis]